LQCRWRIGRLRALLFWQRHRQVRAEFRQLPDAQVFAVERLFNTYLAPDGVTLVQRVRVDPRRAAPGVFTVTGIWRGRYLPIVDRRPV
jgi:hypothetical protein